VNTPLKSMALLFLLLAIVGLASEHAAQTGEPDAAAPKPVAENAVGERGDSCLLVHRVEGEGKRLVVLRNVRSSLCGNTGAVALLVVNGEPKVHGVLTKVGSSLQVDAGPGDHVVATVHTIPLFNGIECIRLGELHLALDVRDR